MKTHSESVIEHQPVVIGIFGTTMIRILGMVSEFSSTMKKDRKRKEPLVAYSRKPLAYREKTKLKNVEIDDGLI